MSAPLAAALGIGALLAGLLIAIVGLVGTRAPAAPEGAAAPAVRRVAGVGLAPDLRRRRQVMLLLSVVIGTLVWLISGIPLMGIAFAVVVLGLPWLFGAAREETRMIVRLDAIEMWTRRLSDLVRSGAGLHQAIIVSAQDAPPPIAAEIGELATELRSDVSTADALRRLADRLDDASSDEVIAAVMLNARERGPRLADVLDRVSESMADLVTMRREVSSSRTDARISGQILSALTLGGLVLLVFNKKYMHPYHTLVGQAVLAGLMVLFGVLLVWCRQLNRPQRIPRLWRSSTTGRTRP